MPGTVSVLPDSRMGDWSIGYLWGWTNLLERFWLTALALMLLYVFVNFTRVFVRYRSIQYPRAFSGERSWREQEKVLSELRRN